MLNDAVDKLIEERNSGKCNPNLRIELPYSSKTELFQFKSREPATIIKSISSGNIDHAAGDRLSAPNYPSDTFKLNLYHCLKEILPKADEILRLSGQIYTSSE